MEQQNTSSHPLLPPGFTNPSFASTFSGVTFSTYKIDRSYVFVGYL
ncbi:unnamed protein product [Brugia timori]|uniref:Uncharacterized protein n=1 Tax=Brugia timori TaxID=42155 RepID=A0A0R3RBF9_9BILA|nr:unnamed protein product [Brugia timori]